MGAGCACRAEETVRIDIHGHETRTTVGIDGEVWEVVRTTFVTESVFCHDAPLWFLRRRSSTSRSMSKAARTSRNHADHRT